ncbi:hypothetical protein OROMI_005788 [Orobanche minor]
MPRGGKSLQDGQPFYVINANIGIRASAAAVNVKAEHNTDFGESNHDSYRDLPSSKKIKIAKLPCGSTREPYQHQSTCQNVFPDHADHCKPYETSNAYDAHSVCKSKRDGSNFEDDEEVGFMSRDEIERCSPSRKDGIDQLHETHLRYSYCAFLQDIGIRLDLPQTTIGTAMILCHRFFVRCSHATHDRFKKIFSLEHIHSFHQNDWVPLYTNITTSVLFLAAKYEETPCALNDVFKSVL